MATTVTTSPFTSPGISSSVAAFQMTLNPTSSSNSATLQIGNSGNGCFYGALWTNDPVANPNPATWNQVSNYPGGGTPNSYPVTPNQVFYIIPMFITSGNVPSNNWQKYAPGNCTINANGGVNCSAGLQGPGATNIVITLIPTGGGGPDA